MNAYFDIDNILADVDINVNVEVNIIAGQQAQFSAANFEGDLEEFNGLRAEVMAMLGGAPENAAGRQAVEQLVIVATRARDGAVTESADGGVRRAVRQIHSARVRISNAKRILEHASEWEPDHSGEWTQWGEQWQGMRQELVNEGQLESVLGNWEQYAENIRDRWTERLRIGENADGYFGQLQHSLGAQ